jgi:hypothetical protein
MNRDSELDLLLAQIRKVEPSDSQLQKWSNALSSETPQFPIRKKNGIQRATRAAAMLGTGFLLGWAASRNFSLVPEKNQPYATAQYIYSKSE